MSNLLEHSTSGLVYTNPLKFHYSISYCYLTENPQNSFQWKLYFKMAGFFFLLLIKFHTNSPWRPAGLLLSPCTALCIHLASHRIVNSFLHVKANQPYGYWKRNLLLNTVLIWRTSILKSWSDKKKIIPNLLDWPGKSWKHTWKSTVWYRLVK